jgi:hypothetical protein
MRRAFAFGLGVPEAALQFDGRPKSLARRGKDAQRLVTTKLEQVAPSPETASRTIAANFRATSEVARPPTARVSRRRRVRCWLADMGALDDPGVRRDLD